MSAVRSVRLRWYDEHDDAGALEELSARFRLDPVPRVGDLVTFRYGPGEIVVCVRAVVHHLAPDSKVADAEHHVDVLVEEER